MSEMKEFEDKTVDLAIEHACEFFGKDRDNLEIEILDGGSTGIFGLGGRKSRVQARPRVNYHELENLVSNVVERLLQAIIENPKVETTVDGNLVEVEIKNSDDSGLIIGKEGQTISALQYLANRIVAKRWSEKIRVQLDAGDYREKQDENLRKNAVYLAKRAKNSGKPQSTKPMTSYHRRLVHLALQEDEGIFTRSKGDGPLKRVLILPKKNRESKKPLQEAS